MHTSSLFNPATSVTAQGAHEQSGHGVKDGSYA